MGLWSREVVPRLIDRVGGSRDLRARRGEVCRGLAGRVLEVGFGSGLNVPHYSVDVTEVFAVEPSDVAWRLSRARRDASGVAVTRVGLDGHALDLGDASCDAALITFTLCTVDDPARVLAEVARVVRPTGEVHVLEHGLSPASRVATWQRRLDPVQRRLFDGCRLTREPVAMLTAAGLSVVIERAGPAPGPKPWTYLTSAVALRR
ncbi:MAG: class I SAM-dependent methyltransferase [Acidimicrobiales bacterium]